MYAIVYDMFWRGVGDWVEGLSWVLVCWSIGYVWGMLGECGAQA